MKIYPEESNRVCKESSGSRSFVSLPVQCTVYRIYGIVPRLCLRACVCISIWLPFASRISLPHCSMALRKQKSGDKKFGQYFCCCRQIVFVRRFVRRLVWANANDKRNSNVTGKRVEIKKRFVLVAKIKIGSLHSNDSGIIFFFFFSFLLRLLSPSHSPSRNLSSAVLLLVMQMIPFFNVFAKIHVSAIIWLSSKALKPFECLNPFTVSSLLHSPPSSSHNFIVISIIISFAPAAFWHLL